MESTDRLNDRPAGGSPISNGLERMLGALGGLLSRPSEGVAWYVGAIVISRILLLVVVGLLTGGRELSNDMIVFQAMVQDPFGILLRHPPGYHQNAPLLPILEALATHPFRVFLSDFFAFRLGFIVYEAVLAAAFLRCLTHLGVGERRIAEGAIALLILPAGWMVSTVMAQDEIIGAATLMLAMKFAFEKRALLALFTCSFGVAADKIFLVIPLGIMGLSFAAYRSLAMIAAAAGPIVLVYGFMAAARSINGYPLPLSDFRPDPYFGSNFWPVLRNKFGLDLRRVATASGLAAIAAAAVPACHAAFRGRLSEPQQVAAATAGSLLLFFAIFYHVNPEYLVLVVPVLALAVPRPLLSPSVWAIAVLPWLTKFLQAVEFQSEIARSPGKQIAVDWYQRAIPLDPGLPILLSQAAFTIVALAIAWRLFAGLRRKPAP